MSAQAPAGFSVDKVCAGINFVCERGFVRVSPLVRVVLVEEPNDERSGWAAKIGGWAASFVLRVVAPRFNDVSMLVNPLADCHNEDCTIIKMIICWRKERSDTACARLPVPQWKLADQRNPISHSDGATRVSVHLLVPSISTWRRCLCAAAIQTKRYHGDWRLICKLGQSHPPRIARIMSLQFRQSDAHGNLRLEKLGVGRAIRRDNEHWQFDAAQQLLDGLA
jgi:hypothetical protein